MLGKSRVIENQDGIALGRQVFSRLVIERVGVPLHRGEQLLELLFDRAGDDDRQYVIVRMRMVGQDPGQVVLQRPTAFASTKRDTA